MNSINPDHVGALAAQSRVVEIALEIAQLHWSDDHAHKYDALQYAEEQLAIAARQLAEQTDRLPDNAKPVGWTPPNLTAADQERRDRDLIARHLRSAASALNITDWPAYLRECADGHDANASWCRP